MPTIFQTKLFCKRPLYPAVGYQQENRRPNNSLAGPEALTSLAYARSTQSENASQTSAATNRTTQAWRCLGPNAQNIFIKLLAALARFAINMFWPHFSPYSSCGLFPWCVALILCVTFALHMIVVPNFTGPIAALLSQRPPLLPVTPLPPGILPRCLSKTLRRSVCLPPCPSVGPTFITPPKFLPNVLPLAAPLSTPCVHTVAALLAVPIAGFLPNLYPYHIPHPNHVLEPLGFTLLTCFLFFLSLSRCNRRNPEHVFCARASKANTSQLKPRIVQTHAILLTIIFLASPAIETPRQNMCNKLQVPPRPERAEQTHNQCSRHVVVRIIPVLSPCSRSKLLPESLLYSYPCLDFCRVSCCIVCPGSCQTSYHICYPGSCRISCITLCSSSGHTPC